MMEGSIFISPKYGKVLEKQGWNVVKKQSKDFSFQGKYKKFFGIGNKLIIGGISGEGFAGKEEKIMEEVDKLCKKLRIIKSEIWSYNKNKFERHYAIEKLSSIKLSLKPDLNTLLKNLHKKNRNAIRNAIKKGVIIKEGGLNDFEDYYKIVKSTADRKSLGLTSYKTMKNYWSDLLSFCKLFFAEVNNKKVSAAMCPFYGKSLYYMQGGSVGEALKTSASNLLHWKIIEWAKSHKFKEYEMWGIDPVSYPSIARFKERFGGKIVPIYRMERVHLGLLNKLTNILRFFYKRFKTKSI